MVPERLAPQGSTGYRGHEDGPGPRPLEDPGTLRHRAARRGNIIHEEDSLPRNPGRIGHGEGPPDVGVPLLGRQSDLGSGGTDPAKSIPQERQTPLPGQDDAHEDRLVETPLPQSRTVERNGDDHIGGNGVNKGGEPANGEKGQGAAQMGLVAVLVAVNKHLERTVVEERATGTIEGGRSKHAAAAEVVDPPLGPVGYATDGAKGRGNGGHGPEAGIAKMEPAPLGHRFPAHMTKGGKEDVKKRPEEFHLEPHILVDHKYPQVGEAGLAVDDGGNATDPVGGVAVGAEAVGAAGGLVVEAPGIGR